MALKIKVCGMKYEENINAVAALQPNYLGFIFYPKSQRFVGLDFENNHLQNISRNITKVAVFVNAQLHEVIEFSRMYGISTVQLHGDETPAFCKALKDENFTVIKAFGLNEDFHFEELNAYENVVDYFLFDTKTDDYGGSGKVFGWEILSDYKLNKPFFLSGGLSNQNLKEAVKLKHPQLFAFDLNSKFEEQPGIKNKTMLEEAFQTIRNTEYGK